MNSQDNKDPRASHAIKNMVGPHRAGPCCAVQQGPSRILCCKKWGGTTSRGSALRRPAKTLVHFVQQKMMLARDRRGVCIPGRGPATHALAPPTPAALGAPALLGPSARARTPLWESPEALPSELPPRWGQAAVARRADRGGCRLHHRYPVYVLAIVPPTEPRP